MRFTIERMRALVLAAAVLLVVALVIFLAIAKWKSPLSGRDIPKRLGIDIQQEANGFTFAHALGAHSQFKIHASRVVQLKEGNALLHDVRIEMFGADGSRVDHIEGSEFEYDQKSGLAKAVGPVVITLTRAAVELGASQSAHKAGNGPAQGGKAGNTPLVAAARSAASGDIHIQTSGLTFNQNSGVATTSQKVNFSMTQGTGSAVGAVYDSQQGSLVLDRQVDLTTRRGGEVVEIHAQHAEFERQTQICRLHAATADYRDGAATSGDATILFRDDGSVVRLDASNGFTLTTTTGGRLAAPAGWLKFDEHNQPQSGFLTGGVKMDSVSADGQMQGTAPSANLEFASQGELRRAHLERGVEFRSEGWSRSGSSHGALQHVSRTWRSPVADLTFRSSSPGGHAQENGLGQLEPASIYGTGGVVITSESRAANAQPARARLAADEVTGAFGPNSMLSAMSGVGHASVEQTAADGSRTTATGDTLDARFASSGATVAGARMESGPSAQVESAVVDGHVVLTDQPAARSASANGGGARRSRANAQEQTPIRAKAGRAVYQGEGGWLHLTLNPRVENGGIQLAADKIDISQQSGDAYAHGDVKGTWIDTNAAPGGRPVNGAGNLGIVAGGGQEPAHVIAQTAHLHKATEVATFRGHVRLWQQADSISGPVIILDRRNQTLVAHTSDPAEPVWVVLLSAAGAEPGKAEMETKTAGGKSSQSQKKPAQPSVIRVRGGDLKYSAASREAVMTGGLLERVEAETNSAQIVSDQVRLLLTPSGQQAARAGRQGEVQRIIATGHVVLRSQGRHGTGQKLTYASKTGEYVLTGIPAALPRLTDPSRGTLTGKALIFNSGDDSVRIEGGGRPTRLDTTAPK